MPLIPRPLALGAFAPASVSICFLQDAKFFLAFVISLFLQEILFPYWISQDQVGYVVLMN
jgi:hypothetical protein